MLHATERINGMVLWANLFLLFWMSLVPFVIRWMDEAHFAPSPTAAYGVVLVLCSLSYILLERAIIKNAMAQIQSWLVPSAVMRKARSLY